MRFGLNMMKYAINHPGDFSLPVVACIIGLMYANVSMMIAFACIIKMCTQTTFLDTLSSYVSYTAICFLPNFVQLGLPVGNHLKTASPDLLISNHRRTIEQRSCIMWFFRAIYKCYRCFYGAVWFYFLPFTSLVLPFACILLFSDLSHMF